MKRLLIVIGAIFLYTVMPVLANLTDELNINYASSSSSSQKLPKQGPPGPPGPPGPQGPPGESGKSAPEHDVFGSFYTLTKQLIKSGEKILFDNSFFEAWGVEYSDGDFKIKESGFYEISYGISKEVECYSTMIALKINESIVSGSHVSINKNKDLKCATIIIPIKAEAILSVINSTPDGIIFPNYFELVPAYAEGTVAFITIRKIHEFKDN